MVLITGCLGYIGYKLTLELLELGKEVIGIALLKDQLSSKSNHLIQLGVKMYWLDIANVGELLLVNDSITEIYHFVGIHSSIRKMEKVFIEGCRNILLLAKRRNVDFILIASNGAYNANNLYGDMIRKMEEVCDFEYQNNNVPVVVLRIGEVYGNITSGLIKMKNNHLSLLGTGDNYVSVIHIDDLIEIIKLTNLKILHGQIYHAVDYLPITQRYYYEYLCKELNLLVPTWIGNNSDSRIQNSIFGLKALSVRMCSKELLNKMNYKLKYPTYKEGIHKVKEEFNDYINEWKRN